MPVQLYYGGWVCPNIYFMGYSGVVRFGELRVAGLSGIWKPGDYRRGYSERPPYSASDVKSAYHCREYDVWKLRQVAEPLDVFVSHDWPRGVAAHGDMAQLMRSKPFLKAELQDGSLGSQPAAELLAQLQPDYWFSAHLHCKFPALVPRRGARPGATRFLALDKCLPKRDFLQVIDLPNRQAGPFAYDEEWLSIIAASHAAMPLSRAPAVLPGGGRGPAPGRDAARAAVAAALAARGSADVPLNFERTARAHDPAQPRRAAMPTATPRNPQTCALLEMLQLDYKLDAPVPQQPPPQQWQQQQPMMQWGGPLPPPPALSVNPEEIDLGDAQEANPEELELPE
jgi:lariat debranching enzyme